MDEKVNTSDWWILDYRTPREHWKFVGSSVRSEEATGHAATERPSSIDNFLRRELLLRGQMERVSQSFSLTSLQKKGTCHIWHRSYLSWPALKHRFPL